jgi:hypothetical protein
MTPIVIAGCCVGLYLYLAGASVGYAAAARRLSPADEVTIQLQQMRELLIAQLDVMQSQQEELQRTRLDLLNACSQRRPLWEPNPR